MRQHPLVDQNAVAEQRPPAVAVVAVAAAAAAVRADDARSVADASKMSHLLGGCTDGVHTGAQASCWAGRFLARSV